MRTPRHHGQFFCFAPRESPYIFSKFNPFYTDTPLSRPVFKFCFVPEESPNIFSKFDQLVITDSFFALSLGKALTFSLNSTRFIRTPVNTDNGHLHLAQSTDFHRKPTTLMGTLHYQLCKRPFLFEGQKTFNWSQHVDDPTAKYTTWDEMICRRQLFQTYFGIKRFIQRTVLIK